MANAVFDKARSAFLRGDIKWVTDDIRIVLIDAADYAVDIANHEFMSSVPVAARVAEVTLTGKAILGAGEGDCNDFTFNNLTGDISEALLLYQRKADAGGAIIEGTSRLIAYYDTASGLPLTPIGDSVPVAISGSGIIRV